MKRKTWNLKKVLTAAVLATSVLLSGCTAGNMEGMRKNIMSLLEAAEAVKTEREVPAAENEPWESDNLAKEARRAYEVAEQRRLELQKILNQDDGNIIIVENNETGTSEENVEENDDSAETYQPKNNIVNEREYPLESINIGSRGEETTSTTGTHTHSYVRTSVKNAICTISGKIKYRCECGAEHEEIIKPLGHSYMNGTCVRCGYVKNKETEKEEPHQTVTVPTPIPTQKPVEPTPHVHSWDRGTTIMNTDCQKEGERQYRCTTCGETRTETIPKTEHRYGEQGRCIYCGYTDSIFRGYGRYLTGLGIGDYEKMLKVVSFTRANGYGGCTGYTGMCIEAAGCAGLNCVSRQIGDIQCQGTGEWHTPDSFNADGYCMHCGLGDNHHWVRFYIGGDFYEFDIFAGDSSCIVGANRSRY